MKVLDAIITFFGILFVLWVIAITALSYYHLYFLKETAYSGLGGAI